MSEHRSEPAAVPSPVHVAPGPQTLRSKLCILSVVDRSYQHYLPTLAFSALTAYPNCTVLLATEGRFRWRVARALRPLHTLGDLRLMEHVFDGFPQRGQEDLAFRRFVFDHPSLDEFDYIYIPDSDLFMCPETPTLIEQHVAQAQQFGLPYSNVLRPTQMPRLHGWHFIIRRPYQQAMGETIARYRHQLQHRQIAARTNDEHLLYRMVTDAGLGTPPRGTPFLGNHGLHLGRWSWRFRTRRDTRPTPFTSELVRAYVPSYLERRGRPEYARGAALIAYDLRMMEREYRQAAANQLV